MPKIAIVWDFDGTLTPYDSTTVVYEFFKGEGKGGNFWAYVHSLGEYKEDLKHLMASDAPIWMYALSMIAKEEGIPLNDEFFREFIVPQIKLYANVINFLKTLKELEEIEEFKKVKLEIHHFIISAGLKELVELFFPEKMMTCVFGCRYTVRAWKENKEKPESVPVFCMDQTMKTRCLFEISKGAFADSGIQVNTRVKKENLWVPFENMIYVGDGDTDIPSLSLTRDKGGIGIAVYNPELSKDKVNKKMKKMRMDKRADLITPANFSIKGELFKYIKTKCIQIRQRCEAEQIE